MFKRAALDTRRVVAIFATYGRALAVQGYLVPPIHKPLAFGYLLILPLHSQKAFLDRTTRPRSPAQHSRSPEARREVSEQSG